MSKETYSVCDRCKKRVELAPNEMHTLAADFREMYLTCYARDKQKQHGLGWRGMDGGSPTVTGSSIICRFRFNASSRQTGWLRGDSRRGDSTSNGERFRTTKMTIQKGAKRNE